MPKRIDTQIGERVFIERHSFVSENRKDVILRKRQEAKLYKINRTLLWAKSMGAQSKATNYLVNSSYGFLQLVNDIQAFFVTDNLVKSLAARYMWTKGGKFLAGIQNKVVPSGLGPFSRLMRVQAGRQSKKILAGISSNLFVSSEFTIVNVKAMENQIKNQLSQGAGLGRKWAVTAAAFAVSDAPDPYSHAQKIMGSNKKRSMDGFDFESNQAILKNSDTFMNLVTQGANPAEAKHYMKYLATGNNPNALLDNYRDHVARKRRGEILMNGTTGRMRPIDDVLRDLEKETLEKGNKLAATYDSRRSKGDFEITGTRIIKSESGEQDSIVSRKYENFGFGSDEDRANLRDFLSQFSDDEIDEFVEGILGYGRLSEKFGPVEENENIGKRFNILWNLGREVSELNRLRNTYGDKIKVPHYKGRKIVAKSWAKAIARGTEAGPYTDNALRFVRLVSKSMIGSETGFGFNHSKAAKDILSQILGTADLEDYNEMSTIVGNKYNGRIDDKRVNYKVIKSSNNPNDPNYIPSRFQIQKAIHIDDEFKSDVFMNFSVSFGGKTPRSKYADAIRDAQQIEFGGPATSNLDWSKKHSKDKEFKIGNREDGYIYKRTLFMNKAGNKALKAVGINANFRTPTKLIDSINIKGKIKPTEKQKGFTMLIDKRLRDLMTSEIEATNVRGVNNTEIQRKALKSLFDDPMGEKKYANAIADRKKAVAIRNLQKPGDRIQMVGVDEDGLEKVFTMKMVDDPAPDYKFSDYQEKVNDAINKYGADAGGRIIKYLQNYIRTNKNFQLGPIRYQDVVDGNMEKIFMTRFPANIFHGTGIQDNATIIDAVIAKADEMKLVQANLIDEVSMEQYKKAVRKIPDQVKAEGANMINLSLEERDNWISSEILRRTELTELQRQREVAAELAKVDYDRFLQIAAEETIQTIEDRYKAIAKTSRSDTQKGTVEVFTSGQKGSIEKPIGGGRTHKLPKTSYQAQVEAFNASNKLAIAQKINELKIQTGLPVSKIKQLDEYKEFERRLYGEMEADLRSRGIEFTFLPTGQVEARLIQAEANVPLDGNYDYREVVMSHFEDPTTGRNLLDDVPYDVAGGKTVAGAFADRGVISDAVFEEFIQTADSSMLTVFNRIRRKYINSGLNNLKIDISGGVVFSTDRTKNLSFAKGTPLRQDLQQLSAFAGRSNQDALALGVMFFATGDSKFTDIILDFMSPSNATSDNILDLQVINYSTKSFIQETIIGLERKYAGDLTNQRKKIRDFLGKKYF